MFHLALHDFHNVSSSAADSSTLFRWTDSRLRTAFRAVVASVERVELVCAAVSEVCGARASFLVSSFRTGLHGAIFRSADRSPFKYMLYLYFREQFRRFQESVRDRWSFGLGESDDESENSEGEDDDDEREGRRGGEGDGESKNVGLPGTNEGEGRKNDANNANGDEIELLTVTRNSNADRSAAGKGFERGPFVAFTRTLHSLGLVSVSEHILTDILFSNVESFVADRCSKKFEEKYLDHVLKWCDIAILSWLEMVLVPTAREKEDTPSSAEYKARLLETLDNWKARLMFFVYETFAKQR